MIKEFEKYHGIILSRLIHNSKKRISIEVYPSKFNSSYIIDKNIGIYIKYSKKRLSPWRFSFLKEHQNEIAQMNKLLKKIFIIFVCHNDGIAALSYSELKNILNEEYEEIEWVAIQRRSKEKYTISGHDGKLKYKIGENEFPQKLFR